MHFLTNNPGAGDDDDDSSSPPPRRLDSSAVHTSMGGGQRSHLQLQPVQPIAAGTSAIAGASTPRGITGGSFVHNRLPPPRARVEGHTIIFDYSQEQAPPPSQPLPAATAPSSTYYPTGLQRPAAFFTAAEGDAFDGQRSGASTPSVWVAPPLCSGTGLVVPPPQASVSLSPSTSLVLEDARRLPASASPAPAYRPSSPAASVAVSHAPPAAPAAPGGHNNSSSPITTTVNTAGNSGQQLLQAASLRAAYPGLQAPPLHSAAAMSRDTSLDWDTITLEAYTAPSIITDGPGPALPGTRPSPSVHFAAATPLTVPPAVYSTIAGSTPLATAPPMHVQLPTQRQAHNHHHASPMAAPRAMVALPTGSPVSLGHAPPTPIFAPGSASKPYHHSAYHQHLQQQQLQHSSFGTPPVTAQPFHPSIVVEPPSSPRPVRAGAMRVPRRTGGGGSASPIADSKRRAVAGSVSPSSWDSPSHAATSLQPQMLAAAQLSAQQQQYLSPMRRPHENRVEHFRNLLREQLFSLNQ